MIETRIVEAHSCRFKDEWPLVMQFFQTDIEKMMFFLQAAIEEIESKDSYDDRIVKNLGQIKYDLTCKIERHHDWGEWV